VERSGAELANTTLNQREPEQAAVTVPGNAEFGQIATPAAEELTRQGRRNDQQEQFQVISTGAGS